MTTADRKSAIAGVGIACFVMSLIATFISRGDFTGFAIFGFVFLIVSLLCWFSAPMDFGGTTNVSHHYKEEHHHYYPQVRRTDGVETVTEFPDGSVKTVRQLSRWE